VRPLGGAALGVAALALAATLAGCESRGVDTARAGDRILGLPGGRVDDERAMIDRTLKSVGALLDQLPLPAERKRLLASLKPTHVVQGGQGFHVAATTDSIVLATSDLDVGWASNAIIVAAGGIHLAHCKNSIVISGRDVQISHDGGTGDGSLVVSKGNMHISNARGTLIYAVEGVEIENAHEVRAFNTPDRKATTGSIDNTAIEPLFQK